MMWLIINLLVSGIVFAETKMEVEKPQVQLVGKRASIAVAKISVKAPKYKSIDPEGTNMHDMIITALFKTGRFLIYEREIEEELQKERAITKQEKEYKAADIMVTGAITGFEPKAAGREIGGGMCLPIFGGLFAGAGTTKIEEAYIAADIRVVDVKTGAILGASRIEGRPGKREFGFIASTWFSSFMGLGGLNQYQQTPIEEAIYDMLDKIVGYLVNIIPASYFTH